MNEDKQHRQMSRGTDKLDIPDWTNHDYPERSSLQFATIISRNLVDYLKFEGELIPLKISNWKDQLEQNRFDFLLIESCFSDSTGDWDSALSRQGQKQEEFLSLMSLAKKRNIPVVFWHTLGPEFCDHFTGVLAGVQYLYCADQASLRKFNEKGILANLLSPAVQPAFHNPFCPEEKKDRKHLWNIICDNSVADQIRDSDLFNCFGRHGLYVYDDPESKALNPEFSIHGYEKTYLGKLTPRRLESVFKYAKIFLTKPAQKQSNVYSQWMTLIAVSCGAVAVSIDTVDSEDIRYEVLNHEQDPGKLVDALLSDELFRGKIALRQRRKIFLNHTFSHRFQTICRHIGIPHDWCEYPRASITTSTYRPHCLENAIENFKKQTYPEKELAIVFNSDEIDIDGIRRQYRGEKNIQFFLTPREASNGEALNVGFSAANGEYIFKMDDDDFYGENYILDMMLSTRAVQFDFFGKRVPFIYLESENKTYERRMRKPEYLVRKIADLDVTLAWIGGNTFCCKKVFFDNYKFSRKNIAAADSEFQLNIDPEKIKVGIADRFNVVINRSAVLSHTWRVEKRDFNQEFVCDGKGDEIVFI